MEILVDMLNYAHWLRIKNKQNKTNKQTTPPQNKNKKKRKHTHTNTTTVSIVCKKIFIILNFTKTWRAYLISFDFTPCWGHQVEGLYKDVITKEELSSTAIPRQLPGIDAFVFIKGYYTPNLKLVCFVLYLKIINTLLKK